MSASTILIFSIEGDISTTEVMRCLDGIGETDVVRVNAGDRIDRLEVDADGFELTLDGRTIALDDIRTVWYRKGDFWFTGLYDRVAVEGHAKLSNALNRICGEEERTLREYFHHLIRRRTRVLGDATRSDLNKPIVLDFARTVGFKTPEFVVSNRRATFEQLLQDNRPCITKSLSDGLYLWDFDGAQSAYFTYTERLTPALLSGMPEVMPPSLAQEEIRKAFELRVFYLDGDIYTMAILSQRDTKTQVDFRKYNLENPNRTVPYALSREVEDRIRALFDRVGLNTGSVDLMVDTAGEIYFLEINPVGQYDWVSRACNYHLDHKIAAWLADRHG
jgi:ATP-GRASP peptide maturase of grasp-with-spasm system